MIYEIDLEQNFLLNRKEIDESIDLSFFVPNKSITKQIDEANPFKQTLVDFSLEGALSIKPSVYVIDFVGDGVQSRAIIRRGAIVHRIKETYAGVEITFFWDDGRPIDDLIIRQNDKKRAVKEKHIIPFGDSLKTIELIAVKDGFAHLLSVAVPK